MGAQVVYHLFDSLSKQQQQQVRSYYAAVDAQGYPAMSLPAFSSLYVKLHNGQLHTLRREIIKLFSARPNSLKAHEQLAQVPFIEQIITTNYDSLFEQAYGTDKLHVVTTGNQLPYQELNKVTLYKVHGSLERPDSLVITEDDYRNFFAKADRLLWNNVESLMTTRTMLFVGYGLEDPNVLGLFEQILNAVGGNMRGAYLVAPQLSPIHVDQLKRHNVSYLDCTGEELVDELIQYFKDNTLPALNKGAISIAPVTQFLRNLGLNVGFRPNEQGFEVTEVRTVDKGKSASYNLHLELDRQGHEALSRFEDGHDGLALKLDTSLLSVDWRVEGVNMGVEIKTLWMVRAPATKKVIDVEFGSGFYLQDVALRIYGSKEVIRYLAYTPHTKLEITIPAKDITKKGFTYQVKLTRRQEYFDSVGSGLEHGLLMQAVGRGDSITCYENGTLIWKNPAIEPNNLLRDGMGLEQLMLALQRIEKVFRIHFRRFTVTNEDKFAIHQLDQALQMESHIDKWTSHFDVKLDVSKQQELINEVLQKGKFEHNIYLDMKHNHSFVFMGWTLQLNFQTRRQVHEPILKKGRMKDFYRLTSGNQQLEAHYYGKQEAQVLIHGSPHPIQLPSPIEVPNELTDNLLNND